MISAKTPSFIDPHESATGLFTCNLTAGWHPLLVQVVIGYARDGRWADYLLAALADVARPRRNYLYTAFFMAGGLTALRLKSRR